MTVNKNVLVAVAVVLLGTLGPLKASTQTFEGCITVDVPEKCQPAPRLTINAESKKVAPPNMCVQTGKAVQVNVVPGSASVRIVSKDGAEWLSGQGKSFSIDVPASAAGRHDYAVFFEDGTCLDPALFGLD
jgi:hypothetical protein